MSKYQQLRREAHRAWEAKEEAAERWLQSRSKADHEAWQAAERKSMELDVRLRNALPDA